MPENNKTNEFLQKLAPCIERGELEACVEEAARVAGEMGIGAEELWGLYANEGFEKNKNTLAYVLALAAEKGLSGEDKSRAFLGAAFAAQLIEKFEVAENYYKKALEINPKNPGAHSLFALLLHSQKRLNEAKEQYETAIKYDPNGAMAHLFYSFLLLENNKIEESRKEFEKASKVINDLKLSSIRAVIYQKYSDFYNDIQNYKESSKYAAMAGDEYLIYAEITNEGTKNDLIFQGNVLKAKSFVRKIPKKSWYKKIFYRFGYNNDISELIENLRNAATYYEKASLCQVDEKKEVCNACNLVMNVFFNVLNAMDGIIKNKKQILTKKAWLSSLEQTREIYITNKLNNGIALVDTLEQLINCVDELSNQKASGVSLQEYSKKCYDRLIEVSTKLDGVLKVITYQSVDVIKDYLKKQGIFVGEETKISTFDKLIKAIKWVIIAIILAIIGGMINRFFELNRDLKILNFIKSLFFGIDTQ